MDIGSELVPIYGEALLRYALAVDGGELAFERLSEQQQSVAQLLASQGQSVSSDTSGFERFSSLTGMGTWIPQMKTSFINYLRTSAGGAVAGPSAADGQGDPVLIALQRLLSDLWPVYLVPPPSRGPKTFWMSGPVGVFQHPASIEACARVLLDEDLANLFPLLEGQTAEGTTIADFITIQSNIYTTLGGGGLQLVSLIGFLISDSVFRCLIEHGTLTWELLLPELTNSLEALRRFATKRVVNTPTLIGLNGLQVAEDLALPFPHGTVRAPRKIELELFLDQTLTPSAVWETTFPLKLLGVEPFDPNPGSDPFKGWAKVGPRITEAARSFQREFDLIRLSLIMSSSADAPLLASETSRFILDPTRPGGVSGWNGRSFSTTPSHPLTAEHIPEILEWHKLVTAKHPASLDVGLRRLLSATTTRDDSLDAFVDAVIVWENLFGTQTETTFRVTGALAKLLEPVDLGNRTTLQKELRDLYSGRSRLVHGSTEPTSIEAFNFRARAVEIAAEALRRIYRDRPDLLNLASEDRSKTLLLE